MRQLRFPIRTTRAQQGRVKIVFRLNRPGSGPAEQHYQNSKPVQTACGIIPGHRTREKEIMHSLDPIQHKSGIPAAPSPADRITVLLP